MVRSSSAHARHSHEGAQSAPSRAAAARHTTSSAGGASATGAAHTSHGAGETSCLEAAGAVGGSPVEAGCRSTISLCASRAIVEAATTEASRQGRELLDGECTGEAMPDTPGDTFLLAGISSSW